MPSNDFIVPFCNSPVRILYTDQQLLFVDKPSGLLSVPGKHPANKDCLISRVQLGENLVHDGSNDIQSGYPEARIVHRLDMDTSGVMVVALNADCHRALSRQFEQRQTEKHYRAVVYGVIENDEGRIELPIIGDWPNRPLQKICTDTGKPALTDYQVLSRNRTDNSSQLLLKPVTGRSHQLRVHLAAIGHPILGCSFYAHSQALASSARLLLHASLLTLTHPISGKAITINCPAPF